MAGDLWQPFLDGEAIAEADEGEESEEADEGPTVGVKRKETKETKDVRRSLRNKSLVAA